MCGLVMLRGELRSEDVPARPAPGCVHLRMWSWSRGSDNASFPLQDHDRQFLPKEIVRLGPNTLCHLVPIDKCHTAIMCFRNLGNLDTSDFCFLSWNLRYILITLMMIHMSAW